MKGAIIHNKNKQTKTEETSKVLIERMNSFSVMYQARDYKASKVRRILIRLNLVPLLSTIGMEEVIWF